VPHRNTFRGPALINRSARWALWMARHGGPPWGRPIHVPCGRSANTTTNPRLVKPLTPSSLTWIAVERAGRLSDSLSEMLRHDGGRGSRPLTVGRDINTRESHTRDSRAFAENGVEVFATGPTMCWHPFGFVVQDPRYRGAKGDTFLASGPAGHLLKPLYDLTSGYL